MNRNWLIVACGAVLMFSIPERAHASDSASGLEVRAEVRAGFSPSRFPESSVSRVPFVVPLREVWESGANTWSPGRRASFVRTTTVRSAVVGLSGKANAERGDRDPAQWLPAASARCAYAKKWVEVKKAWNLTADPAEAERLARLIGICGVSPAPSVTTSAPTSLPAGGSTALDLLATIRIVPEFVAGYNRELFPHWKDLDGDGCDTRKEVLIRDSLTPVAVGARCSVVSGTWYSPYDGATWTKASDVDIDHVVALNEAWQSGGYAWSTQQRTNFANDLSDGRTLMAVTDSVNQSKSDKDPAAWLPPLASYRCNYVANWVSVKARWSLAMDEAEHAVVKSVLAGCTDQTVPAPSAPPVATPAAVPGPPSASPTGSGQTSGFVRPGAYCTPVGATGVSEKGKAYTCKPSDTEARNRWRP